jgi:hypothetical protein
VRMPRERSRVLRAAAAGAADGRGGDAVVALGARTARQETEINAAAARYLTRTGTYAIDRARVELGYEPRVSLAEGMERSGLAARGGPALMAVSLAPSSSLPRCDLALDREAGCATRQGAGC